MSVPFAPLSISHSAGSLSSSPVLPASWHQVPGFYLRTVPVSGCEPLSLSTHVLRLKVNFAGLGLISVGQM